MRPRNIHVSAEALAAARRSAPEQGRPEPRAFRPACPDPLAMEPQAFFALWDQPEPKRDFELVGQTAIVTVDGPLCGKPDPWGWWDSYPEILSRVEAAFASDARDVLIRIDSPGGDVHGCFEAARSIRDLATASGKPLRAEVKARATSAGYALACAADKIECSQTAALGSIGVITAWTSFAGYDAKEGFETAVIASGTRKADCHPAIPISDDAKAAQQTQVDQLAKVFLAWVEERRGIPEAVLRAMEANTFLGAAAVAQRLADGLIGLGETLRAEKEPVMEEDDVKEALRSLAEGGNEKAKAALKAMEDESEEPAAEDAPAEDDKEETAEGAEETEESAEEEEEEPKAAAPVAAAQASAADPRFAALEARQVQLEKAQLLGTRPDVSKELRASIMRADVSVPAAKAMLAALPKAPKPKPAAAASARPTQGAVPGVTPSAGPTRLSDQADALDVRMGIKSGATPAIRMVGNSKVFGVVTPAEAQALRGKVGANG